MGAGSGGPRRQNPLVDLPWRRIALGFGVVAALVVVAGLISAVRLFPLAREGVAQTARARAALLDADVDAGREALLGAERAFSSARRKLSSPLTLPLRTLPGVKRQTESAAALVAAGELGAQAGLAGIAALDEAPDRRFALVDGRVDLAVVRAASEHLEQAAGLAEAARDRLLSAPTSLVLSPLAEARAEALEILESAAPLARAAHRTSLALPSLLGQDGPRQYFLAFANLAELRGSGGFIGFFAVVRAEDGRISLTGQSGPATSSLPPLTELDLEAPADFRRGYALYEPTDFFQNINIGVHFPTAGNLIVQAAESVAGPLDGVIQIDPVAVSALLETTGPVEVSQWPEPITAANVSQVTQHDIYARYEGQSSVRNDLNRELIDALFARLTGPRLEIDPRSVSRMLRAVEGGHLRMYAERDDEQGMLRKIGVAGHVDRVAEGADVFGLVTVNATPSKADWFLRREVKMDITFDPHTRDANTALVVDLRNRASPNEGIDVVGQAVEPIGTNRQLVLLVQSPEGLNSHLSVAGEETSPTQSTERRMTITQTGLDIWPGTTARIQGQLHTVDALRAEGGELAYTLHILRQPVAHPDTFDVTIHPPDGWTTGDPTRFLGKLHADHVMEVRFHRSARGQIAVLMKGWILIPLAGLLLLVAVLVKRVWERRPRPERVRVEL